MARTSLSFAFFLLVWGIGNVSAQEIKPPNWIFTKAEYLKLYKSGKTLDFADDSDWLPSRYQVPLLAAIHYAFTENHTPEIAHEISLRDFFHAHVACPKKDTPEVLTKAAFNLERNLRSISNDSLGREIYIVNEKNFAAHKEAVSHMEEEAQIFLEWLEAGNFCQEQEVMVFHTLENTKPDWMPYGDPTRNLITLVDGPILRNFEPDSIGSASSFKVSYEEFMQLDFLVDRDAKIHVTVGSERSLTKLSALD